MAYDNDNVFAKILRGELFCDKVYENDHALAFKDIQPQAPVHILVIPKGPYVSMDDFSENASDAEISEFSGSSDRWLAMRASSKLAIECSPTMAMMAARRCRISTSMYLVDAISAAWFAAFRPKPEL